MTTTPVFLLVETREGDTVAVRFPSVDAARDWEDEHIADVLARGCVHSVSKSEALRLSR